MDGTSSEVKGENSSEVRYQEASSRIDKFVKENIDRGIKVPTHESKIRDLLGIGELEFSDVDLGIWTTSGRKYNILYHAHADGEANLRIRSLVGIAEGNSLGRGEVRETYTYNRGQSKEQQYLEYRKEMRSSLESYHVPPVLIEYGAYNIKGSEKETPRTEVKTVDVFNKFNSLMKNLEQATREKTSASNSAVES